MYSEIDEPVRSSKKVRFLFSEELNHLNVLNFGGHQGNANKATEITLEILQCPLQEKTNRQS